MKRIELKICMGTMCYIMGGAELKDLVEMLPSEMKQHVDITFSSCLECCDGKQRPPFIELNGKIMSGVSKANLMQILKEESENVVR